MTLLHALFHAKHFQAFQRLLDGGHDKKTNGHAGAPGTSGGHRPSPLSGTTPIIDINARDWLGRTALHLAVVSEGSLDYLRALLKHPNINVNLADTESQWTPLHRALYHANIPAARLLLQRSDIDTSLKDKEGYTTFDVYNSTLHGTKPDMGDKDAELFTWGANRHVLRFLMSKNAALGLGDGNDRAHPDRVVLTLKDELEPSLPLLQRFSPIHVRDVQMSKLHTAVITSESSGNLRACGFGSGGRLGRGQQMQYNLNPLPDFDYTIVAIALGQDHTLAVTKNGEILSWGLNRFSQLGYVVETTSGKFDEPIQAVPKKILNPLRKEVVIGVAACKTASACWTEEDVYTWGTNHGQLGYDKHAHPVQVYPRKVTKFSQPIVAMCMTDNVIACLLRTQQVECIWNDRHYRVNFPVNAFPSEIQPYRPPQAIKASHIAKIAASDDLIAALSSNGEVFTFSPPSISSDHNTDANPAVRHPFQPQRIWALRKKFSSVRDVAIGADGSIIICTESGHVYTRIRSTVKGAGKNFKFQKVPYLQRITRVSANSTGAFGALRVDYPPRPVKVEGNSLAQDLKTMEPFRAVTSLTTVDSGRGRPGTGGEGEEAAEDGDEEAVEEREDADLEEDVAVLRSLIGTWRRERERVKAGGVLELPQGVDTVVHVGNLVFRAHRVVLAARSSPLLRLLDGGASLSDSQNPSFGIQLLPSKPGPGFGVTKVSAVKVTGVNPLSLLILLHYLYSDEILAIWDRRINLALAGDRKGLNVDAGTIKSELQILARALELPALVAVLPAPVKRFPTSTLPQHFRVLFTLVQGKRPSVPEALRPDVVLQFADREVRTHSVILTCRSAFFEGMFGSGEWTERRWGGEGDVRVECGHLEWRVVQYVVRFICGGEDKEMFEVLEFVKNVDELLEFMFDVMGVATELLLDRLILICSSVILDHLTIHNCAYILSEATYYHADQLADRVHEYIAANLESLLELGLLDDLPLYLLKGLSRFIAEKQKEKSGFTRGTEYVDGLLAKYWDWLEEQDVPSLIVPASGGGRAARTVGAREGTKAKGTGARSLGSSKPNGVSIPTPSTVTPQLRQKTSGDELFAMDDLPPPSPQPRPAATSRVVGEGSSVAPAWKVTDAPRVDMKALMAEAQLSTPNSLSGSPKYVAKKTSTETGSNPFAPTTPTKSSSIAPRTPNSPWRSAGQATSSSASASFSAFPSIGAAATATTSTLSPRTPVPPSAGPSSGSGLSMTRPAAPSQGPPPSPLANKTPDGSGPPLTAMPGLGPVITPTKQPSKVASNSIRVAFGKAWTLPPPEPVKPLPPARTSSSSSSNAMSFAAIQQAELARLSASGSGAKDKRTLKEIQQEEAELRQEAEFLKWWTEEEERTKREMEAQEASQHQGHGAGQGSGRGQGRGGAKGGRGGKSRQAGGGVGAGASGQVHEYGAGTGSKKRGKGKGTAKESSAASLHPPSDDASAKAPEVGSVDHQKGDAGTKQGVQPRRQHRKPSNKERPPTQQ